MSTYCPTYAGNGDIFRGFPLDTGGKKAYSGVEGTFFEGEAVAA